jgi:hypothetical protein
LIWRWSTAAGVTITACWVPVTPVVESGVTCIARDPAVVSVKMNVVVDDPAGMVTVLIPVEVVGSSKAPVGEGVCSDTVSPPAGAAMGVGGSLPVTCSIVIVTGVVAVPAVMVWVGVVMANASVAETI